MLLVNLLIYVVSFVAIWFGSGLIVNSTSKFSSSLKLSPFIFSFAFLGILTSTPEFSVGMQSVASGNSEIFVGNLLGGIIVLFLLIIPLLAVFGNGVSLKHELTNKTLIATLGVILAPSVLILDKKVTNIEGAILVLLYLGVLYIVQKNKGIFDRKNSHILNVKSYSYKDVLKILLGLGIVFVSSSLIVDKTTFFAESLNISAFYVGLLVIAVGTDLPELTLAVRSVVSGKRDIAMGDYIGAAAASTFMFGIFTLLSNGEIVSISSFVITFIFIAIALGIFYVLSRTKQYISRSVGLMLLGLYVIFIALEIFSK